MNRFVLRCLCAALGVAPLVAPPIVSAADAAPPASGYLTSLLTLDTVLRDVASANPSLVARRAMTAAAEARTRPAGAWDAPMLEVGVVNLPTSGGFDADEMTMKMVGLSQRVPLYGPNGLRRRAAAEQADAEGTATERAQLDRIGEAIDAYADAYFALERARLSSKHRGILERYVQAAEARYRSGSGRLDDVLRAEAERARMRVDEAMFLSEAERALALLAALRGLEPGGPQPVLAPPPVYPIPPNAGPWLSAAREGHPRLREADARRRGYEFAARAASRMKWPGLELRASYGQRGRDPHGMELDDMLSASVGLMLPIFSGSREGAMASEMTAMARAAAAERRDAELDLAREATALHAEAATAARMVALLADTVVTAQQRAVESTWSAYAAGATDLWRIFEANHALYAENLLLLDARRTLARAQGALVALTGRGDLAGMDLPALRRDER